MRNKVVKGKRDSEKMEDNVRGMGDEREMG